VGFGDYPDGFSPQNLNVIEGVPLPGCTVADDFTQLLGNENEAQFAAALAYRDAPGTCPALPINSNSFQQETPLKQLPRGNQAVRNHRSEAGKILRAAPSRR
jgi:hypothetical protein